MKKKTIKSSREKLNIIVFVNNRFLETHKDFKIKLQKELQNKINIETAKYFDKINGKIKRKSIFKKIWCKLWNKKKN